MHASRLAALVAFTEYFLVLGSFMGGELARSGWDGSETWEGFLLKGSAIAGVIQFCFYGNDLYSTKEVSSRWVLFRRFVGAMAFAIVLLAVTFYLIPPIAVGRGVLALTLVFFTLGFFAWRLTIRRLLGARWLGKRYLIMGTGDFAKEVGRIILDRKDLGYELQGFLDVDAERVGEPLLESKVLGTYEQIAELVEELQIDEVVVALANRRGTLPVRQLLDLKFRGVAITEGVTFYEREHTRVYVRQLNPSWVIFNEGFAISPFTRTAKRVLDIALVLLGMVGALPLLLVTAVLIKLTSPGPALYSQERAGLRGRPFTMWKFRSMRTDAEKAGPQFAGKNDPRVTPIGRFIRKTRIDELPQLFNILKGDMSLVGPRPERPVFIAQLKEKIPFYDHRLQVKPGLTGLAQVTHGYTDGDEDHLQKLQYDLCYIKNLSVGLDVAIIAKTIKVVILGTGAR